MKKLLLFFSFALMTISASKAQSNAIEQFTTKAVNTEKNANIGIPKTATTGGTMPIYLDEPITEAPDGTVVKDMIRKGFSYYYSGGSLYGGYNDTFAGEIVLGEDGNIYIKKPCASVDINTYLKLEPVAGEEGVYVMHTAQMVYVDMSYGTPYTYYATRLVLTELSGGQFTWQMEEVDGQVQGDIYFTYQDGVLRQRDQTIVAREVEEWDGSKVTYYYPYEIVGWTSSTGGWIGYGDGCMEFAPASMNPTTLPDGAEVKVGSFNYDVLSSRKGGSATNGMKLNYAEVNDEYYLACPMNGSEMWIKGAIDRTVGTVTFEKQYLGIEGAVHLWFVPATFNDWFDLIDPEDNYGTWYRDYTATDKLVMSYDNGVVISDKDAKQALVMSHSESQIETTAAYANPKSQLLEERFATPQVPYITRFDKFNGLWGEFAFYLPPVDETGMLLDKEKLYYRVYLNHSETPHVFKKSDYMYITKDLTDIPYLYDDDIEFMISDRNTTALHHWLCFYDSSWTVAGVQSVMKDGNEEKASAIVWSDGQISAIENVTVDNTSAAVTKVIRDGQLRLIRNGIEYSIDGARIK